MKRLPRLLSAMFTFAISLGAHAQTTWINAIDPNTTHNQGAITSDAEGNLYVITGYFCVSGSSSVTGSNSHDCFVSKFNSNGVLQWSQWVDGGFNSYPADIVFANGKVYASYVESNSQVGKYGSVMVTLSSGGAIQAIDWDYTSGCHVVPKKILATPGGVVYTVGEESPTSVLRRLFATRFNSSGVRVNRSTFSYGVNLPSPEGGYTDSSSYFVDAFAPDSNGVTLAGNVVYPSGTNAAFGSFMARLDAQGSPWAWYRLGDNSTMTAAANRDNTFAFSANIGSTASLLKFDSNLNVIGLDNKSSFSTLYMLLGKDGSNNDVEYAQATTASVLGSSFGTTYTGLANLFPYPNFVGAKLFSSNNFYWGMLPDATNKFSFAEISPNGTGTLKSITGNFSSTSVNSGRIVEFAETNGKLYALGMDYVGGGSTDHYTGWNTGHEFLVRLK